MSKMNVLYCIQGESKVQALDIESEKSTTDLKNEIRKAHDLPDAVNIFLENEDETLSGSEIVENLINDENRPSIFHVNCLDKIRVTVNFDDQVEIKEFSPSITIDSILNWAREMFFSGDSEKANEYRLQINGKTEYPKPDVHVGAIFPDPNTEVEFQLVTKAETDYGG